MVCLFSSAQIFMIRFGKFRRTRDVRNVDISPRENNHFTREPLHASLLVARAKREIEPESSSSH